MFLKSLKEIKQIEMEVWTDFILSKENGRFAKTALLNWSEVKIHLSSIYLSVYLSSI